MSTDDDQQGMAAELDRLLGSDAVWDEPDEGLEDAVVAAIASRRDAASPQRGVRRRPTSPWSWWSAGVAAAVATVVTAVVLLAPWQTGPDGRTLAATPLAPSADALVSVSTTPAGTVLRLDVEGLAPAPEGMLYHAWMLDGDRAVSAGTFHLRGGDDRVGLWGGVEPEPFDELAVTLEPVPTDDMAMDGQMGPGIDQDQVVLRGAIAP